MQTNVIHCGNHLDVLKNYPDGCFDMFLTSPPYDKMRKYKGYEFNFEALAPELYRTLKDGGVGVWIVDDSTKDGTEKPKAEKQLSEPEKPKADFPTFGKTDFREINFGNKKESSKKDCCCSNNENKGIASTCIPRKIPAPHTDQPQQLSHQK